jgi:predicted aspartyl protease
VSEYVLHLVCAVLGLQVALIVLTARINRRVVRHLREAAEQQRETWGLLRVVKEYAASARTHHRDAQAVADLIVPAVAQVPERTADLVVNKIHKDGAGHNQPTSAGG